MSDFEGAESLKIEPWLEPQLDFIGLHIFKNISISMKKGSQNDFKTHEKSLLGRPWVDFLTPWGDFRGILCDLGAPGGFLYAPGH